LSVRIVEVGPRDGLQNEPVPIPTQAKADFVRALAASGLREIEVSSFVSPKAVPQLADASDLFGSLSEWRRSEGTGVKLSALVPNQKGLERALQAGVDRIAVFTAASDEFARRNIGMDVEGSIAAFREVVSEFRQAVPSGWVRGYVSTAFECPYEGRIDPARTAEVAAKLLEIGVDEVSVGDTIGVAAPAEVRKLTRALLAAIPRERLAYHFHDTRGTAIANVAAAMDMGIQAFDSSAAGLGGCPFAPGAGGNLATEDLVYFLERSGIPTGISLESLAKASLPILEILGRAPAAKAQAAALASSSPTR